MTLTLSRRQARWYSSEYWASEIRKIFPMYDSLDWENSSPKRNPSLIPKVIISGQSYSIPIDHLFHHLSMNSSTILHLDEVLDRDCLAILPALVLFRERGSYLAGGTALALFFGHRESEDFDFLPVKNSMRENYLIAVRDTSLTRESKKYLRLIIRSGSPLISHWSLSI